MAEDEDLGSIVEFSEDIGEAEAPEPLPIGEYPAEIRGAELKTSQRGTRYAAVSFFIKPEDYPADYPSDAAPDGKTVIYRRVSMEDNQRARYMCRLFCEAVGAPMSKQIDVNEWVSLAATISIEHDTFEGVTREQIARVNPA